MRFLTSLTKLNLHKCEVESIYSLNDVKGLKILDISHTNVQDISSLAFSFDLVSLSVYLINFSSSVTQEILKLSYGCLFDQK
eukprot:Pgem_evm1s4006